MAGEPIAATAKHAPATKAAKVVRMNFPCGEEFPLGSCEPNLSAIPQGKIQLKDDRSSSQPLRHPVGALQPPAVAAVVGDVAAVLDDQELARTFDVTRQPLGVLPRHHAVELAGDDEHRAGDLARHA